MPKYEIVSRDRSSCSYPAADYSEAGRFYESNKDLFIDPESTLYGHLLVKTKPVRYGFKVEFFVNWARLSLKPRIRLKYSFSLEWLIFNIKLQWQTYESSKHGEVAKDWLEK